MILLIFGTLSLWLAGRQGATSLPPAKQIDQRIFRAPVQEPTTHKPFNVQVEDQPYRVQPKFTYDIAGLVVSGHHSDSLIDFYHRETEDYLNVCDLAILWGLNAKTGIYEKGEFHNQDFTAWVSFDDQMDWMSFRMNEFSNNHLITEKPEIRRTLKNIRIGDQVRIKGYLAEYFWPPAYQRGTSTTREDTGNHACETIYVTEVQILTSGNAAWRAAHTAGKVLTLSLVGIQALAGIGKMVSRRAGRSIGNPRGAVC